MANEYCSFWLLQKYETRDNQTIPVYPNVWSIDGDGTEDPIIRKCNDTACGYDPRPEVQYRWVNLDPTKDYYCDDCPIEPQYRWVDMNPSTDYYCEGTTKYYKQKRQVSYDEGQTWEDVVPAEYQRGNAYETESTDCGYVPTTIYRWAQTEDTICVEYVPPTPSGYTEQYFTVLPRTNGTIRKRSGGTFSYSYDSGTTWTEVTSATSISMIIGEKIMFKGTQNPVSDVGIGTFSVSGNFNVEGNIMSLLFGDNFADKTNLTGKNSAFSCLFSGCTGLTSIENLVLPATTLAPYCYYGMFRGCTSLESVPSNLLPATSLKNVCYGSMFRYCASLTIAPPLPATTLAEWCYSSMFQYCISLTTAPELPATTLANDCYHQMFDGCTSLTTAPVLPATRLSGSCYDYMFYNCSSLNKITCLATSMDNYSTDDWVKYVSSTGTFYKNPNMTGWGRGTNGIPTNWTVQDYTD